MKLLQKFLFSVACLIPAAVATWSLFYGDLGAQPAEALNHRFGTWALRLLCVNLTWGSLVALGWWPAAARRWTPLRRHLGVITFVYALAHLAFYFVKEGDLVLALQQMFTKVYLVLGLAAFVILLALAVTSTDRAVRRLRRNWKRLHRLAYPALGLAVVHFQLIEKKDWTEALPYLLPTLALYVVRAVNAARPARAPARPQGRSVRP